MNTLFVKVGKYGRIVLPKELREKYNVDDGSKLILREHIMEKGYTNERKTEK